MQIEQLCISKYFEPQGRGWDPVNLVKNPINVKFLGPVVQSIVSLTTSLRGHLVKYIPTALSNPLLFFVEKM